MMNHIHCKIKMIVIIIIIQTMMMIVFTSSFSIKTNNNNNNNIAIIGGGLAGLSTTYHILQKTQNHNKNEKTKITIYDTSSKPGLHGASSVAAGLLHPFSPRGKIVYKGEEALQIANELIYKASCHDDDGKERKTILRNIIYRPIYKSSDMIKFQKTVDTYPEYMSWLSKNEEEFINNNNSNKEEALPLACVKYMNGCKVIHVPTYLQGLWKECLSICNNNEYSSVKWKKEEISSSLLQDISNKYDIVILTAGAGLFQNNQLLLNSSPKPKEDDHKEENSYPIALVRGQALEMQYHTSSSNGDDNDSSNAQQENEAMVCGSMLHQRLCLTMLS